MATIRQIIRQKRKKITRKHKVNALLGNPQKKGVCIKVYTTTPRKPNSAIRKVARVRLTNQRVITAYIPGEGHNLQKHSTILVRGGNTKDLPGVKHKVIRGKLDLLGLSNRRNARSKYGTKRPKTPKK